MAFSQGIVAQAAANLFTRTRNARECITGGELDHKHN